MTDNTSCVSDIYLMYMAVVPSTDIYFVLVMNNDACRYVNDKAVKL